ncbi:MAG TPA: flagellar hook-associated protein FlgK [Lacunisphaera sp.]|jgi:flagellar hook-associated protein 1 FlgK
MSGLFSSLNSAVSALSAQSLAVQIAGKNLANVNNPDYARQRVVIGSIGTIMTAQGPESMGVAALSVQQMRDSLLDQQVSRESALTSYYNAQQQSYQRAESALGQTIDGTQNSSGTSSTSDNGVAAAVDDLFNSFQSFAADPTDPGQRQTLLQNTSILTDRIQLANQRLTQVSSDLDSQITSDVTSVNRLAQTIADLNGQISRLEVNNPGSAVDLRDQREADIEQLSAQLPVESQTDSSGKLQLVAKDGSGNNVVLVDGSNVQGTVAFDGTQITAGSPATTLALSSGAIQGYLSARDGGVKTIRDNLDQLAKQLVTSVNAAYNPSGTTGDFFDASGTTAATISMDSSVTSANLKASDGGAAGDNTVALAVAQLATQKFSVSGGDAIDGTFGNFLSSAVSNLGQAVAGATAQATDQSSIEQLVRSQRDGVSGVSLDEETANLLQYQRAFQASSRVFNTIDDLLDTVVNHLGA